MKTNEGKRAATAVVIDSQPLRQQHARALLQRHGVAVVAVSSAIERASELADVYACDLLIVGLDEGVDAKIVYAALRKAHKRCPGLVTVALVENDHPTVVEAALSAGAFAAVGRSTSMQEIARVAFDAIAEGSGESAGENGRGARTRLTRREIEILRLVARGLSNREIGATLTISEHTAANHIRSILRKTGCANRTEATTYAHGHGLVEA